MKPEGVVAVSIGVAMLTTGAVGGVVVVTVCSLACGATAPTVCSGWPEPMLPKITPNSPKALTAPTPIVANPDFHCFACISARPIRSIAYPASGPEPPISSHGQTRDFLMNGYPMRIA
jgi:hypothetical protein